MYENDKAVLMDALEFNRPELAANFALWAKKAHWTLDEGAALLLGRSPELVTMEMVRPYVGLSIIAGEFAEIVDRASRAVDCGQLARPVSPVAFLAWAKNDDFDVPADLERCVRERGEFIADWQSRLNHLELQLAQTSAELSEKTTSAAQLSLENEQLKRERDALQKKISEEFTNPKERTSVYRLLVGTVYAVWKFNPTHRDNEGILGQILNKLENDAGLRVDRGTARAALERAAIHIDFIPPARPGR
jgi:hypothetical protein